MMTFIHKEGRVILTGLFLLLLALNLLVYFAIGTASNLFLTLAALSLILFLFNLWFFRQPKRPVIPNDDIVLAPADGKVVAIEEVFEPEYFQEKRLQVSIFMSPLNVHVNRYPVTGTVKYLKYHKGKYLVAWHPKSSELNERTSVVIENHHGAILLRQIAGVLARRIVYYPGVGDAVIQGEDLGFIKFGSRVDLFLPIKSSELKISLGQKVVGNQTVISEYKK
jgi:phosphatidylserine decarboxylase